MLKARDGAAKLCFSRVPISNSKVIFLSLKRKTRKAKMKTLRTQYGKELGKVKGSTSSGSKNN